MPRRPLPVLVALGALLLLAAGAVALLPGRLQADDAAAPHIVFLHLTGEGPTAKAWYKGAPPAGVPVQDALDTFSAQGYRVVSVSPSQRQIVTAVISDTDTSVSTPDVEQYYVVLLERR